VIWEAGLNETELVYDAVLTALRGGESACLLTLIESRGSTPREAGVKMLLRGNGSIVGTIGGGPMEASALKDAREALSTGESRICYYSLQGESKTDLGVCGGDARVFIEVLQAKPTLLIAGAGHVGQPLAEFGHQLGFRTVVADDRPEFASAERFPTADRLVVGPYQELLKHVELNERTFIVIVTRGHEHDELVLRQVIDSPAAYIGMIGSRGKVSTVFERLRQDGVAAEKLARVYAPIGLRTGGQSPAEIAVSILAEIVAVQHGETGEPMSRCDNPMRSPERIVDHT
jgi:xanthine dehydrogenase accessory factor